MKVILHNKQNIFFCSDPHYNHKSIVRGTTEWESDRGCRDFDTLSEHDKTLVNNINNTVEEDDILFCLGDWSFGSYKDKSNYYNVIRFRQRIKCKNVHLILGNHDSEIRKSEELQSLFSSISPYREVCVVDTISNPDKKAFKQHIVLSHYAMRVWNKGSKGAWMLYGHSHGNLDEMSPLIANPDWIGDQYYIKNYRTMDVGFDTHSEFRPYSYMELKDIMSKRKVELEIEHH